jgi:hypothetical protein
MRNITKLITTTILAAGLISAGPANALTLNLGGGPGGLIQTGGGGVNITTSPGGSGGGGSSGGGLNVGVPGTNSGGTVDLFGNNTDVSANTLGGGGNRANVSLGLGGLLNNLFGANGGDGSDGGDGTGGGNGGQGSAVRVASFESGGNACFMPTRAQLDTLMNRHSYAGNLVGPAASIQIVKVPLCAKTQSKITAAIAGNGNLQMLHDKIDASARLTNKLANAGYSSEDVIAVDRQGGKLIVYVLA